MSEENNKYKYVLEGKDFKTLTAEQVNELKDVTYKAPKGYSLKNRLTGIAYQANGVLVLTSNSMHDILDAAEDGKLWQHSSPIKEAKVGDRIFVFPNDRKREKLKNLAGGLSFELTKEVYKAEDDKVGWTTNTIENKSD